MEYPPLAAAQTPIPVAFQETSVVVDAPAPITVAPLAKADADRPMAIELVAKESLLPAEAD